jgi:signal transduction histidine kinase
LLPSQDKFSIEFAALSFLSPETNRFRYRMQGLQEEWTEVGSDQRVATFMALPAGAYAFQLQSAASHGPWSDTVATLQIVMLPPWWNSWTFFLGMGLAAIASLSLAYRLRVRQLARAYNVRLEERWAERTRIARELHDTLLQSFQGLMFRLQTVRNLLPAKPDEAITVLDPALVLGEDAIDEARNAVDGLRASEKVVADLESGLTAIAAALADITHTTPKPSWTVVTTGRPREVRRTVLYELYPVAQEALSNAFRHACSRTIAVESHHSVNELRISVTDDGVGFDDEAERSQQSRRHWGLQGMRERVERLGGQLSVRSCRGDGTVVSLTVPADLAYRKRSWIGAIARRFSWLPQARSVSRE